MLDAGGGAAALRPTPLALPRAVRATGAPQNPPYTLDAPLPVAELSPRTHKALLKSQITTIRQFCALELRELMWLRNFGKKAVAESVAYRARLGFPLSSPA